MGTPTTPLPVKLFVGMLATEPSLFDRCSGMLTVHYGPVELESPVWDWRHSDYYADEMGAPLLRKFICFQDIVDPAILSSVKHHTNRIEAVLTERAALPERRTVNLDPGYVTEAKVVLASTKDYAHRISIGDGIYAEVTLVYRKEDREFSTLDHTYPDFRSGEARAWFLGVRERLRTELGKRRR